MKRTFFSVRPGYHKLKLRSKFLFALIPVVFTAFAASIILSGCGLSGSSSNSASLSGTLTPTPTRDPSGYQVVEAQSCQVASMATMQSNLNQGQLIAFQPNTQDLAFLKPTDRTSWYVGTLVLAKAPDYQKQVNLAPSVLVAGDLTWSPGGTRLAFLAYRPNESWYTVMTVKADGSGLTDLFPEDEARTDTSTGDKSIVQWKGEDTLEVITSCGEECRKAYDIQVSDSTVAARVPTTIADYHELLNNLKIHSNVPEYTLGDFPKIMITPNPSKRVSSQNWSPDDKLVAYLDKRGYPWVLSIEQKVMYQLDIGLRDVYETEWSYNSQTIGLRAEDQIFIFEIPCQQKK